MKKEVLNLASSLAILAKGFNFKCKLMLKKIKLANIFKVN